MNSERPWLRLIPTVHPGWDSALPSPVLSRPQSSYLAQAKRPRTSEKPITSREPSAERLHYSTKYLGITGGEIGILTVRRPIPVSRPATGKLTKDRSVKNITDSLCTPDKSAQPADKPPVQPDPHLYDEFLVTKYLRPRPLTPNKTAKTTVKNTPMFRLQRLPKHTASSSRFATLDQAPVRTQSCVQLPKPGLNMALVGGNIGSTRYSEAYIQYLLLKKRIREACLEGNR